MYIFAPYTSGSYVTGDSKTSIHGSGSGWNIPTPDMIASYEAGDKRKGISPVPDIRMHPETLYSRKGRWNWRLSTIAGTILEGPEKL